ncbi:MAG TPA: thiamine pyrophosphate-binding protein [Steroidobacteraceae bacterium]|jgi:acetolactate synthase-1/2/3 large subunit|nr:thiamine pyrophosphate-binding protein [Steroidobacteraceae bacterium]
MKPIKHYVDGGEALLAACRAAGIDYLFSCPGSEWAPAWEAVALQKHEGRPGPTYLDLWHETVAVGMATGYTQVTGRPQAVLLHAGPGLLQGSCAIHGALLSGVPMLVLSSESVTYGERAGADPGSQWYRNLSVVGGPQGWVQGYVKWANQVGGIEVLYEMLLRTTELAARAPAGPCYLNVPVEVLLTPWTPPKFPQPLAAAGRKIAPPEEIEALASRIAAARNPIVLTETSGRDARAFAALVELCDLMALPVIEPQAAVCSNFPRTHPLHLGTSAEAFVDSADLVLLVNCRAPWYPPSNKPPHAATVVIDEVPQRPHVVYQVLHADAYLEGEVGETLRQVTAVLQKRGLDESAVAERRARHAKSHAALAAKTTEAETRAAAASGPIEPVLLVKALREMAGKEAVFVDETITHSRLLQQHLQLDEAKRYYYVQGGLGQGIAVALGVKLATPDRPVILAVGDGSYLYNPVIPSLAAARDYGLPLLIVIFNNRQYLSMKFNHLRAYPEGAAVATQYFPGVSLATQPDLAEFAKPFGMYGATVSDAASLSPTLAEALDAVRAGRTAIVNVMLTK